MKKEVDIIVKRKTQLETNLCEAYNLIWNQCTEVMQNKLKSLSDYDNINKSSDVLTLLERMKELTFKFEAQKYMFSSVYFANKQFYNYKQGQDETNDDYHKNFLNMVSVIESYGGLIGQEDILLSCDDDYDALGTQEKKSDDNIKAAKERNKERMLAYAFIAKSDNKRYKDFKVELENDFNKGNDNYPHTINRALRMLTNIRTEKPVKKEQETNNVTFAQHGGGRNNNNNNGNTNGNSNNSGFDTSWHKDATCHHCGEKGHIKPNCPQLANESGTTNNNNGTETPNNSDTTNNTSNNNSNGNINSNGNSNNSKKKKKDGVICLNYGKDKQFLNISDDLDNDSDDEQNLSFFQRVVLKNRYNAIINHLKEKRLSLRHVCLLDNPSTCDLWCERQYLTDVREVNSVLGVESNGGDMETNLKELLPKYGSVWVHDDAITNILSLKNVIKKWRTTFDSMKNNGDFIVHTPDGEIRFIMHESGLWYYDLREGGLCFLQTVEENASKYTERQYKRAKLANDIYIKIGCPSVKDFKHLIANNLINNCPVTIEDVKNAEDIFGKNIHNLKGKTTRRKPVRIETDYVDVPKELLRLHGDVTLVGDIFFVNNFPFFVTLS